MSAWNYETIKLLAKENGLRVGDLLALAQKNDPFYAGTKGDRDKAHWFADIWERTGYTSGAHLRRVHYWCVSQRGLTRHDGKPYQNTDTNWDYLIQASKMARYLKLVDIDAIIDQKNPAPIEGGWYSGYETQSYEVNVPNVNALDVQLYGLHNHDVQPYHLEVWIEKSTMNDVLEPACRRFGANLVTFQGEVSITACRDLLRRVRRSGGNRHAFST